MFYDYLVLYSDYRADIWYYLAHLRTQKIGIWVILLVNFRKFEIYEGFLFSCYHVIGK